MKFLIAAAQGQMAIYNVALPINTSALPSNVAYIVWNGDNGEIEYNSSLALRTDITDPSPYQQFVNEWMTIAAGTPTIGTTWNPADNGGLTLSNSNLTATQPSSPNWLSVRSTTSHNSGKVYAEMLIGGTSGADNSGGAGVADITTLMSQYIGSSGVSLMYFDGGWVQSGITLLSNPTNAVVPGSVVSLAIDFGAGYIWLGLNGVFTGNPAAGTGPNYSFTPGTTLFLAASGATAGASTTLRSAGTQFSGTVPAGFTPWDGPTVLMTLAQAQAIKSSLITAIFNSKRQSAFAYTVSAGAYSWDCSDQALIAFNMAYTEALLSGESTAFGTLFAQLVNVISATNTALNRVLGGNAGSVSTGLVGGFPAGVVGPMYWTPIGQAAPVLLTSVDATNLFNAIVARRASLMLAEQTALQAIGCCAHRSRGPEAPPWRPGSTVQVRQDRGPKVLSPPHCGI